MCKYGLLGIREFVALGGGYRVDTPGYYKEMAVTIT